MAIFESVGSIIIFVLIIAFHVLSRFFAGRLSLVFSLINIALHVAIAPVMLLSGCPLSELALVYAASFLVHLALIYVRREDRGK